MEPGSVNLATAAAAAPGEAPAIPPAEARKSYHLGMFGSTPPFTRRERRVFWIATTAGFFRLNHLGSFSVLARRSLPEW
jgi:hypothetical protein